MVHQPLLDAALVTTTFGAAGAGDIPVPGDYDCDGHGDLAFYRTSTAEWSILLSGSGRLDVRTFGNPSLGDIPVPGRYSTVGCGGKLGLYRRTTGQWLVAGGAYQFGSPGLRDVPVPADYDGDGASISLCIAARPVSGSSCARATPPLARVGERRPRRHAGAGRLRWRRRSRYRDYRSTGQWFILRADGRFRSWAGARRRSATCRCRPTTTATARRSRGLPRHNRRVVHPPFHDSTLAASWGAPALGDVPVPR